MIWERDYMKQRSGAKGDTDAADTAHSQGSASDHIDIFEGVERQDLPPQAPPTSASGDFKINNSSRTSDSSAPLVTGQPELPLNRLLAKYPRFFWYAAIAILGIVIGILLGKNL